MLTLSQPALTPAGSNTTSDSPHGSGEPGAHHPSKLRRSPRRPAPASAARSAARDEAASPVPEPVQLDDEALELLMTPEIKELMATASSVTKVVDSYILARIGHTRLFFDIYFAQGSRTIQVADGPKLTAYKCNCGCVHPQGNEWWPIPAKSNSQAIYDHLFSKTHITHCKPDGLDPGPALDAYVAYSKTIAPRSNRWETNGNKESRDKTRRAPRAKFRKSAKVAKDDPAVVNLFQDPNSIASHALNALGPLGLVMSQGQQAQQLTQQLQQQTTRTH
jgi:hypothetical protein